MLKPDPQPLLLSQKQASALLGVTRWTLWEWGAKGKAPPRIQVKGRYYYPRDQFTEWMGARKAQTSAQDKKGLHWMTYKDIHPYMSPATKKHQQLILLEPEKAKLLDELSAKTRIPKQALLREAVDDLLSLNGLGPTTNRVREVRNAFKKARPQLIAFRKEIEIKKQGTIPLRNCQEAIDAVDRAREEFGD